MLMVEWTKMKSSVMAVLQADNLVPQTSNGFGSVYLPPTTNPVASSARQPFNFEKNRKRLAATLQEQERAVARKSRTKGRKRKADIVEDLTQD